MNRSSKETNPAFARLAAVYLDRHPDQAARDLEKADPDAVAALLADEPVSRAFEVVRLLTPAAATDVLSKMDAAASGRLLDMLEANRAAALLAGMESQVREERLAQIEGGKANELRELMPYPQGSAGQLMNPRVITFRGDATVRDVVRRLRTIRARRVQDIFLVDDDDHLTGAVAIQDALLAPGDTQLDTLVRLQNPSVTAFAPREEVLDTLEQFRARSLPVVDYDGRILGVLRQEELIEAAQQAATADIVSMVGAGRDERALSPPFFAIRKRLP
jgi:magnesium transporter